MTTPIQILGLVDPDAVLRAGEQSMQGPLHVGGQIESSSGGFKFPDGTVQTTAASANGWTTALDLDFAAQASQSLSSDGEHVIAGKAWIRERAAGDRVGMVLTQGQGIIISPAQSTNYYGSDRTAPIIRLPVLTLIPAATMSTCLRISLRLSANNMAENYDQAGVAYEWSIQQNGAGYTHAEMLRAYAGAPVSQMQMCRAAQPAGTPNVSRLNADCLRLEFPAGVGSGIVIGSDGLWNNHWPDESAWAPVGVYSPSGAATATDLGPLANHSIILEAGRAESGNASFAATFARLKVEYRS